jgi:hypothetical protein
MPESIALVHFERVFRAGFLKSLEKAPVMTGVTYFFVNTVTQSLKIGLTFQAYLFCFHAHGLLPALLLKLLLRLRTKQKGSFTWARTVQNICAKAPWKLEAYLVGCDGLADAVDKAIDRFGKT